jgi:heme-degrading monooxygenase HmoA
VTAGDGPVASLTLTRYAGWRAVAGAFHMASQRRPLSREPGLRFFKLVGTGSGIGFSRVPDLALWGLFAVWERTADWERFRSASRVMRQYEARGEEIYSLLLRPLAAHGRWDGVEPFGAVVPERGARDADAPVVVLTRASIRLARQLRFWDAVPRVDATLQGHPDLLLTFGVGELPYLRQATLSVWRSARAMQAWAYGSPQHAEVVRRTRDEAWYAEDLFARFQLLRRYGTFHGADPLEGIAECGVGSAG